MKPTTARWSLPAIALACLLALAVATPAVGERFEPLRPIVRTKKIAPGLLFTRIVQRQVPRRTFVLKIDPSRALTVDVTIATPTLPARRATSGIANAHGALAATNGDYNPPGVGRPVHVFAQDGDLVQSARLGPLFGFRRDEGDVLIGQSRLDVTVTNRDSGRTWAIDRWNRGAPAPGEIVAFSPLGGTLELPPRNACSVRLLPGTSPSPDGEGGVIADYVVDEAACSEQAMARDGGVVLSAAPATKEATELLAMAPGTPMRVRWALGWDDVFDVVGGGPILLQDGQVVPEPCTSSTCRHPRTAIGWTSNGRLLLVVIDGRQPRWSVGVTLFELALIMQDLGAIKALNLDGGGSSTMVVQGEVVNRPSDGQERLVTNAVLVLPGKDPGEA